MIMEITESIAVRNIATHCKALGLQFSNNYFDRNEDNLIEQYSNWELIASEISDGKGNELKGEKSKFKALRSSCALCVNTFAPIKQYISDFNFLGDSDFTYSKFEKGLPTGISTPDIDFYIKNNDSFYAFESKYIEHLTPKLPNWIGSGETVGNLQKYVNRQNELNLPDRFIEEILNYYINIQTKMYLDVSQLIKHVIGIMNHKTDLKKTLVYIYWLPVNHLDFELFEKHEAEINEFKERLYSFKNLINFHPITYINFWNSLENNERFRDHIKKVKHRYNIKVTN